jgi:FAD/FMN-containing dehydrogenase
VIVERQSLVAEVPADLRVERFEVACLAQGFTPGPLSEADPHAPLSAALRARAGRRSLLYGDLWDRVLALEAELPGGRTFRTRGAPRAATGPDLCRTVLEGRGRYGEVRRVWMRLWPSPRERRHLCAGAPDLPAALAATARLVRAGARPAEVEVEGSSRDARIVLRIEGDPVLVGAEVAVARKALEGAGLRLEEGGTLGVAAGGAEPDASAPVVIEAPWSRIPSVVGEMLDRIGAGMPGPARLAWLGHEAAGVAFPWPRGIERPPAPRPREPAILGDLEKALARRCR